MNKAKIDDKAWIVNLLCKAFIENKSVNYIILQDENRQKRLKALMDYSFDICSMFGEVWLSEDRRACALILYSHQKKFNLKSIWLDIKLIFTAIGISNIKKAFDREAKTKAKHPKNPMVYLWFIGVNPVYQGSRIGTKLLEEIITDARQRNLPIYLETSTERNLPWYENHGFVEFDCLNFGYPLHFLKISPAK